MDTTWTSDEENSCGVRKIVDVKIVEGGQQMYHVEWESTWEPAESLASCQHLVDDFWALVNKAKANQHIALQHRNAMSSSLQSNTSVVGAKFPRLSSDDKTDVQRLIQRTTGTLLSTPSDLLNISSPTNHVKSLTSQSTKTETMSVKTPKSETMQLPKSSTSADGLKYISNFSNPYVKLVVACKVCDKQLSSKNVVSWKDHNMIHDKSLGHKCPYCDKTFQRPVVVRKHIAAKHAEQLSAKTEDPSGYSNSMKNEDPDWY